MLMAYLANLGILVFHGKITVSNFFILGVLNFGGCVGGVSCLVLDTLPKLKINMLQMCEKIHPPPLPSEAGKWDQANHSWAFLAILLPGLDTVQS